MFIIVIEADNVCVGVLVCVTERKRENEMIKISTGERREGRVLYFIVRNDNSVCVCLWVCVTERERERERRDGVTPVLLSYLIFTVFSFHGFSGSSEG